MSSNLDIWYDLDTGEVLSISRDAHMQQYEKQKEWKAAGIVRRTACSGLPESTEDESLMRNSPDFRRGYACGIQNKIPNCSSREYQLGFECGIRRGV